MNNKNNVNGDIIFNGNGNNNSLVNKQNRENIINKYEINNLIPVRKTEKEIEKEMKETMRPCLRDNVNKLITCFGYVISSFQKLGDGWYTVVNVMDRNGNYLSDHIQLNFKQNIFHYDFTEGDYIRFTGYVTDYVRSDGSKDYSVNIIDKVELIPSKYHYNDELINYDNEIDFGKLRDYLSNSNITKINMLLEQMRKELNDLTKYYYIDDFIYYYILNQFMLNTATYKLYEGELRDQKIKDEIIINIMCILGSVIFEMKSNREIELYDLLHFICEHCNIIQGVRCYTDVNKNPDFGTFCTNFMNCNGKKKTSKLFHFVKLRYLDFKNKDTNSFNITKQDMLLRTYIILNNYIN